MEALKRFVAPAVAGAFLFLLASCAGTTPYVAPERLDRASEDSLDALYAPYGAYYQSAQTRMEFTWQSNPFINQGVAMPFAQVVLFKRLKILSVEGLQHATLEIDPYSGDLQAFEVKVLAANDSVARRVPLDSMAKQTYMKTGKIAVPRVKPGDVISVELRFGMQSLPWFEVWMADDLPVARASFTLSSMQHYHYDVREYGGLQPPVKTSREQGINDRFTLLTWTHENALPATRVGMKASADRGVPRVSAVLRKYQTQKVYTNWKSIAGDYQSSVMAKSWLARSSRLKRLADSLYTENKVFAADSAFAWVARNMRYTEKPVRKISPDDLLKSGEANSWEMAVLMRDLFEAMDMSAEVAITRPLSRGGLDTSFPTPASLRVPVVILDRIGGRQLAFPYDQDAALGEYPADYFGLSALSTGDSSLVALPAPRSASGFSRYRFTLSTDDPNAAELEVRYEGYRAYALRRQMAGTRKADVTEYFQRMISGISPGNALDTVEVTGLETPGTPLTAKLRFRNNDAVVERRGDRLLSLNHLFDGYFSSWDSTRTSPISIVLPEVVEEEVALTGAAPARVDFACREIDNDLFKQTCGQQPGRLTRRIEVRKGELSATEARRLSPAIDSLNASRRSSVSLK